MKLYLSSYRLGNEIKFLKEWLINNKKIIVIPNALDIFNDSERKTSGILDKCKDLQDLGFETEILDLRNYFGKEDELYRILAYSELIDDNTSASKALKQYYTFSDLLNKKYGNKEEFFTPTTIVKTIKNSQGKEEQIEEKSSIGNPEFLSQLQSGTSVLYSTYYNDEVAVALSIGVDGDEKSYIVIDYKNLNTIKKQETKTLDAL